MSLDVPDLVFVATGGRSAHTLWRWRKEGLAIHRMGEGTAARYYVVLSELAAFLRDRSEVMP